MASLVTVSQVKYQLHIPQTTTDRDGELQALADRASATVVRLCGTLADVGWSAGTVAVPGDLEVATLLLIAHMDQHRGDEPRAEGEWYEWVVSYRGPILA